MQHDMDWGGIILHNKSSNPIYPTKHVSTRSDWLVIPLRNFGYKQQVYVQGQLQGQVEVQLRTKQRNVAVQDARFAMAFPQQEDDMSPYCCCSCYGHQK
jgi:hypothetical protein